MKLASIFQVVFHLSSAESVATVRFVKSAWPIARLQVGFDFSNRAAAGNRVGRRATRKGKFVSQSGSKIGKDGGHCR